MSTTTNTILAKQVSRSVSGPQLPAADAYDMTPRAKQIVYLVLLAGVLFLGSIAGYVWYGFYQWRNIP